MATLTDINVPYLAPTPFDHYKDFVFWAHNYAETHIKSSFPPATVTPTLDAEEIEDLYGNTDFRTETNLEITYNLPSPKLYAQHTSFYWQAYHVLSIKHECNHVLDFLDKFKTSKRQYPLTPTDLDAYSSIDEITDRFDGFVKNAYKELNVYDSKAQMEHAQTATPDDPYYPNRLAKIMEMPDFAILKNRFVSERNVKEQIRKASIILYADRLYQPAIERFPILRDFPLNQGSIDIPCFTVEEKIWRTIENSMEVINDTNDRARETISDFLDNHF